MTRISDTEIISHAFSRRSFVAAAAATLAVPYAHLTSSGRSRVEPENGRPQGWAGYDDAVVIDYLASPGPFNIPLDIPLTEEMVRNAAESGITAVNLTVSGGGFESTVRQMAKWSAEIDKYPVMLRQVRSVNQMMEVKRAGLTGIVFGFQDTTPIENDLSRIEVFHNMGVRIIQLTYNTRNLVGDGCLEPGNAGLSTFGHGAVEQMNELGIIVDLSHCCQRTTAEGIMASLAPVACTHTGCSAVAPHPRSKRDEELRMLADRGGVAGIYLMPFLTPGRVATTEDLMLHIEHAVQVCGEDHVGIGSDLSITPIDESDEYWRLHREFVASRKSRGIAAPNEDEGILFMVPELNSHRRMELVAEALSARGHSDDRVEKIIGGNFLRLSQEVWGR
jgi:membrane dipeptidase